MIEGGYEINVRISVCDMGRVGICNIVGFAIVSNVSIRISCDIISATSSSASVSVASSPP